MKGTVKEISVYNIPRSCKEWFLEILDSAVTTVKGIKISGLIVERVYDSEARDNIDIFLTILSGLTQQHLQEIIVFIQENGIFVNGSWSSKKIKITHGRVSHVA